MSITPFPFSFFPFYSFFFLFFLFSLSRILYPHRLSRDASLASPNRTGPGRHLAHGILLRVPQQTPLHPRAGLVPLPSLASSSCGVCSSGNGTPGPGSLRPTRPHVRPRQTFRLGVDFVSVISLWKSLMQFMVDFLSFLLFFCLLATFDFLSFFFLPS